MKAVGMIPARLESSRLPRKALADIQGLPMVIHTCKRANLAKSLDEVYLATDSDEIRIVAEKHDVNVIMTGKHHKTGSDRLAEACRDIDCDLVVNIQGDEPLVRPEHIDKIVEVMKDDDLIDVAVGVTKYGERNRVSDIKAVMDLNWNVLYCSRTDIPSNARAFVEFYYKMCFIVAFKKKGLIWFSGLEETPLERTEFNEYLRLLEHGIKIRAVEIEGAAISVDTQDDLENVRRKMSVDDIKLTYM